jgi:hypothetical protein
MGDLGKLECPLRVDLHIFHVLLQICVCQYSLETIERKSKTKKKKPLDGYFVMENWAASNQA